MSYYYPDIIFQFQPDPELQHKSDMERLRNKQRQREQMFSASRPTSSRPTSSGQHLVAPPSSQPMVTSPVKNMDKKQWKREQDRIDAILNPTPSRTTST